MEINSYKQPELTAILEKHFKGEASRYDVKPNADFLTVAESMNLANAININYKDLQPEKVYALRTTTTDLQTGEQNISYSLFLDRKMAETFYYQNTPKDSLILNHQVQHGIIMSGDVDNKLLAKLNMAPSSFNEMLVVSTLQGQFDYSGPQKRQVEQASEIAKQILTEIPLRNEYAFNTLPKGDQQDLYKYYELTHKENPQVTHTDAWAIQEKKEAVITNEPYTYVGLIHSKDHSAPSVAYTSEQEYLNAIEQGLKNNPQNLGYETVSANPQLQKQVEDLVYRSYGLTNPYPIENYTKQGRETINPESDNHPRITIMELAKELGFVLVESKNEEKIAVMIQDLNSELNPQNSTRVKLNILYPNDPTNNIVDVTYINNSRSHDEHYTDFGLPFTDFVALTKSLNSEEVLKRMENKEEYIGTITYKDTRETVSYLDGASFLEDLKDALKYQPENIKYEILTKDQSVHDKIMEIMYDFFGMEAPQKTNGQNQITIMDLAKELGFTYEGKDSLLGDVVMRYKNEYENKESGETETVHIALSIKNADDPEKNTVNVVTTFFDANQQTIGTYYDNNLTFDQFAIQMKSAGSMEIIQTMQQNITENNQQQTILEPAFIQKMISDLEQKGGHNNSNDFEVDLYHMLKLTNPDTLTSAQYESQVKEIIKLAQQQPENEFAAKIIENAQAPVFYQQQQQYSVETQPIESFKYETASVFHKDDLLYGLQEKFKLDFDTIAKFGTFLEAAHPIDRKFDDNSADIVVFPLVKIDDQYNLGGHLQSTMSGTRQLLGEKLTDHTNIPIGYERYTSGQTIPVRPYTTHAALEGGVWMATEAQKPNQVKDVFLFNSAVDAMSFYELHKNSIDLKNTALISVGNLARENQIYGVVQRFPEAQLHTAFQNTLLGQLSTITAVSLATIGPVKFKTDETKHAVEFTTYYDKFSLPIKDINVQNFKEHAHIKDKSLFHDLEKDLKIHSPQGRSYNEDLAQNKQEQSRKIESTIKM